MTQIEKVKFIREKTMSPINKINQSLIDTGGDIDKSIELLIKQKSADATDMANRRADNNFVYSYVHNNKIGAMIVLASQTDFVSKSDLFNQLAKDICIQIVSNANTKYIDIDDVDITFEKTLIACAKIGTEDKVPQLAEKIVKGRLAKDYDTYCLLRQEFVKNDDITVKQLIDNVSATVGEKIVIKKFVRMSA